MRRSVNNDSLGSKLPDKQLCPDINGEENIHAKAEGVQTYEFVRWDGGEAS